MKCVMSPSGVGDRRDGHFLGVVRAVLAFVDQFAMPDAAGKNGVPERLVERGVLPVGLEHARVPPDDFGGSCSR